MHRLICAADTAISGRILTGLSSGEGLIWAVRDPQGPDPGATDRRLLVIEPDFASRAHMSNSTYEHQCSRPKYVALIKPARL